MVEEFNALKEKNAHYIDGVARLEAREDKIF
jgi:hypothetical protein